MRFDIFLIGICQSTWRLPKAISFCSIGFVVTAFAEYLLRSFKVSIRIQRSATDKASEACGMELSTCCHSSLCMKHWISTSCTELCVSWRTECFPCTAGIRGAVSITTWIAAWIYTAGLCAGICTARTTGFWTASIVCTSGARRCTGIARRCWKARIWITTILLAAFSIVAIGYINWTRNTDAHLSFTFWKVTWISSIASSRSIAVGAGITSWRVAARITRLRIAARVAGKITGGWSTWQSTFPLTAFLGAPHVAAVITTRTGNL